MWQLLAVAANDTEEGSAVESRAHALEWLSRAEPGSSNEWWVVRLLVNQRFGRSREARQDLKNLLSRQNADGGWSWKKGQDSDALATGQTLYALSVVGRTADDPSVRKAIKVLIETQRKDGSWPVRSTLRRKKEKTSETSTYMGTAWAVIGLARMLPAKRARTETEY